MKEMMAGFAAIILIAVAAYYTLNNLGFSSADQSAGDAVRISSGE